MNLAAARPGTSYRISSLPAGEVRAQALRFGINEGAIVTCTAVVPGGPILIQRHRQEIAIGRSLAGRIGVEALAVPPGCRHRRGCKHGLS